MSVRLSKNQIDKVNPLDQHDHELNHHRLYFQASKDKSGKFQDNFNVTLFLVRPNDQTLQAEFSRSNMLCQVKLSKMYNRTNILPLPHMLNHVQFKKINNFINPKCVLFRAFNFMRKIKVLNINSIYQ